MKRAIRIGVTGKLGSGKSTLTQVLAEHGMRVINSDDLAKELMQNDEKLRAKIVDLLGGRAYTGATLDRIFIATQIFQDSVLREKLEALVHPAVSGKIEEIFKSEAAGKAVVVESALILKSDFKKLFDYIILVDIEDDLAVDHAVAAGRITRADAQARLEQQAYDKQPLSEADFVIQNTGSQEDFRTRAETLATVLEAITARDLPEVPLHAVEEEEGE
jgi:dephospho-CoA kinase